MAETRTVLVTGGTGYIAKHVIAKLLADGFAVRATARSDGRFDEIRDAVAPQVPSEALDRLTFQSLDLDLDDGWDSAMEGIDIVLHTASPFPMVQPKDESEEIRPAVDGALRAVKAAHAAGIMRFVMTSSPAAILGKEPSNGKNAFDETCWVDIDEPGTMPYSKSKALAERAVWDWAKENNSGMQITMINPGFVVGAPLDPTFGTSVRVIERIMKGADPMVPNFGFPCVDVEDIAELHVTVIDKPETHGQRIMGVESFVWFLDVARSLKSAFPNRKIATRKAPDFVVRILALFDPAIRNIVPILGVSQSFDNSRALRILGRPMKNSRDAIVETGRFLDERGLV